ncbi:MAG TPA: glycine cleavage system protein H, partial [Anaerolineales bacterium]
MKAVRCPYLETTTVSFCQVYPTRKMIPVGKGEAHKCSCSTQAYNECSLFREHAAADKDMEEIRGFFLRTGYFFHPRHTWLAASRDIEGEVRMGIDDFAQRLIGAIDRVSIPPKGTALKENRVGFLLHSRRGTVKMMAPADGVIHTINPKVAACPSLINRDPYNEGWILSLRLSGDGTKGLYCGKSAERWLDWEGERLKRICAADLG